MNYQQTLDYLYERLPMFTRVGASAFRKDLHNTIALCEQLGNPQHLFKTVHVAGTNGKGSTSHMLAAIFQQAGYKTGLYTSPHLKDFRERIRINGEMIDQEFIVEFVQQVQASIEELDPSFFELTVAMAFQYFALEQVDIAIIEVGLGGRLDSTNIITPELSVITNISYDHMAMLGNTLPEIAGEKAGIIKPNIPVVIAQTQTEVEQVFIDKAKAMEAPITFADQHWLVQDNDLAKGHLHIQLRPQHSEQVWDLKPDLSGQYQVKNIMGVLSAVKVLQQAGWELPDEGVRTALSHVKKLTGLRGRWDVVAQQPLTIFDVGHNEAGIGEIVGQLEHMTYRHLHIVTGFVKDKEVSKVLKLFPAAATYYFTRAQIPRALDEHELAEMGTAAGLRGKAYPTVQQAFQAAKQHAHEEDVILVCGSFFIVGEAM
ncbi:bifunctional folylpolyglutamate synthase/dihydrofolate synthase [Chitinophaga sancti]|uniref:Dihydrofolate synthase/folylpolyglutamate synthase n=1 Tax=Chitinophaga sancti TaxID=1004 RepID=A0A1K1MLA4_9BACT|nr:folylpolyglutamate synthase/dihydrofolate synthase family protein [Chitinophaga sancti]WQD62787.1 folylpolyglutamate synthase/dihydrofolate synthase family protein [Chitinophaga sancti]WQG91589.1 folylpolyglutamate synthase/dihydrofolate synthase family protein [Chitinophaga sancti]SFW23946.1 dihydrofolate synthase / folylpolyglutamate synthase [Chitinophaga sancti]